MFPRHVRDLQAGAKTIHVAAQKGFVEVVRTLLQRGEHVDVKTNVSILICLKIMEIVSVAI